MNFLPVTQHVSSEYLAGLIDGEGYIHIAMNTRIGRSIQYRPTISISNTNFEVLEILKLQLGGHLVTFQPKNPNSKLAYRLTWQHAAALPILQAVLPFLIIKKSQGMVLAQYIYYLKGIRQRYWRKIEGKKGRAHLCSSDLQLRHRFYQKLRHLNHKGVT